MTATDDAAALLREAKRVVIFTGAGISAESGVPTFRDALTGLWERFDAQVLATPAARFGAPVIQIDPQPTPLDPVATINLHAPAARALPELVRIAWS